MLTKLQLRSNEPYIGLVGVVGGDRSRGGQVLKIQVKKVILGFLSIPLEKPFFHATNSDFFSRKK